MEAWKQQSGPQNDEALRARESMCRKQEWGRHTQGEQERKRERERRTCTERKTGLKEKERVSDGQTEKLAELEGRG